LKYLVDTNVLSQATKVVPHPGIDLWWKQREAGDLLLSVVSIHEIRLGIQLMQAGRRRSQIEAWYLAEVLGKFDGRILPVDSPVADASGRLLAEAKLSGRGAELGDVLIAATALVHGLQVVTLNRTHFEGLGVELVEL
jgi:predicted nucleic acid-binding protein